VNIGRWLLTAVLALMFSAACSSSSKQTPILVGDGAAADADKLDGDADNIGDAGQTPEIADDATITTDGERPDQNAIDSKADGAADAGDASDGASDSIPDDVVALDGGADLIGEVSPADSGDEVAPADAPPVDGVLVPPCSGASCPSELGAGHLQLWLRGDRGVDCVAGRIARWADLSPRHNDGAPPLGKWGPICGDAASQINGRTVVSFPRSPDPIAAASEHVEVDFGALAESALTIAVVEQRSDPTAATWIIGTPLPFPDQVSCLGANVNEGKGLVLGYPVPIRALASFWGAACGGPGETAGLPPAAQASTTIMVYVPGTGISLFLNGKQGEGSGAGVILEGGLTKVVTNTGADARPTGFLGRGLIGRGFEETSDGIDSRYLGSIAEVVVYNAALDDSERTRLEAYFHGEWNTLTTP
jgi:hypothetical protein